MKKVFLTLMVAALLMGCAGVQIQGAGNQQEAVTIGLELLAFNGGYLVAEKYPGKYTQIMEEVYLLEGVLAGNNVDAANAAFQIAVTKLLAATNNDPLVAANVMFVKSKIKFVGTGTEAKPLIDIPQMKLILANFKAGTEAWALIGLVR